MGFRHPWQGPKRRLAFEGQALSLPCGPQNTLEESFLEVPGVWHRCDLGEMFSSDLVSGCGCASAVA